MTWQDMVIMVADLAFIIALMPMILRSGKPPVSSSLITSVGMWAITVALIGSGLLYGGIAVGVVAFGWTTLLVQKIAERGNNGA